MKDVIAWPVHWLLKGTAPLPGPLRRAIFGCAGLAWKGYYFVPGNHMRRTASELCAVIGRDDPRRIYFEMMNKVAVVADAFGRLLRHGPEAVAEMTGFDEGGARPFREAYEQRGGAIVVAPHCVGSVLSAAGFGKTFPTVLLVRESRSEARSALLREYLERLGPEVVFVRRARPQTVTRHILRALRERKLIVGTTDLLRHQEDTVAAEMFGQPVWLPGWPARFAARRKVPIVPAYIRTEPGRVRVLGDEPYIEEDVARSTQRWASFFERSIRAHPSDWVFMFEKRWARVIGAAAGTRGAG